MTPWQYRLLLLLCGMAAVNSTIMVVVLYMAVFSARMMG